MAEEYEENILLPPLEFRDGPISAPPQLRDKPIPASRTIRRPVPLPRVKNLFQYPELK